MTEKRCEGVVDAMNESPMTFTVREKSEDNPHALFSKWCPEIRDIFAPTWLFSLEMAHEYNKEAATEKLNSSFLTNFGDKLK